MPKNGEHVLFRIADGTVELSGGDQVFRGSTSTRDDLARDQQQNDVLQGESDGSQPLDTLTDDGEARNDFLHYRWEYMYRHHVEPRVQTLCAEWRIMPNTTRVH